MKKSNLVISSLLALTLAGSVLAGGTYALFEYRDDASIKVDSGSLNFTAKFNDLKTYSGEYNEETKLYESKPTKENLVFENGGSVSIKDSEMNISKLTPMDKVTGTLNFKNESNIKIKYRTKLTVSGDITYFEKLDVKINGKEFNGSTILTDWQNAAIGDGQISNTFEISMPEDVKLYEVDNEKCTIKWTIEAIQGNAHTEDTPEEIYQIHTPMDLIKFADSISDAQKGEQPYKGKEVRLMQNIDMDDITYYTAGRLNKMSFYGTFNGNGYTIDSLTIKGSGGYGYGIFYGLADAHVKDLTMYNANITNSGNCSGIISGYTSGNTTLENVKIWNSLIQGFGKIGGLIGMNNNENYADGPTLKLINPQVIYPNVIKATYNASAFVGLSHSKNIEITGDVTAANNIFTFIPDSQGELVDLDTTIIDAKGDGATAQETPPEIKDQYWKYETSEGYYYYNVYADYYTGYFWTDSKLDIEAENNLDHFLCDGVAVNKPAN